MAVRPLSKIRFDAFCYCRLPLVEMLFREVEWYADTREVVLGTVQFYPDDSDWAWTILGRDGNGQFRSIDCQTGISSRKKARADLRKRLLHHAKRAGQGFIQGDEKKKHLRLFHPVVDHAQFHP